MLNPDVMVKSDVIADTKLASAASTTRTLYVVPAVVDVGMV